MFQRKSSFLRVRVFLQSTRKHHCPKLLDISHCVCWWCHLDALFLLLDACNCSKFCPARLETVGLRVSNRNLRDFTSFRVEMKRRYRRFSKCSSANNPLNAKLNSTCHLLALLEAHHSIHVSKIRVNAISRGSGTTHCRFCCD